MSPQKNVSAASLQTMCSCLMLLLCGSTLVTAISPGTSVNPLMRCEYYNETLCTSTSNGSVPAGCRGTEECKPGENEKGNLCYVLWQNSSSSLSIKLKGCWVGNNHECSKGKHCVETRREPGVQLLFCCCEGDMCNTNLNPTAVITATLPPTQAAPVRLAPRGPRTETIVLSTVTPLLGVAVILAAGYYVYRRHKLLGGGHFDEVPTAEPTPLPSPMMTPRALQLVEVKAQGRFGAVWKARYMSGFVAVKIFPIQDKSSWLVERDMYRLAQMKHENVLEFLGAGKHGDCLDAEYWLITAYHELGSLCDYLKANLVTWGEMLKIAESIACGLTHLHEELPATKLEPFKPVVAHRDFKSKNVLLKSDMTACIADFGLAVVFLPGTSPGEAHGQVGTRRYMAPEVLEGAISFNQEAFLRIDMYACGLVFWELVLRCSAQDGPVDEYTLPFEEEVGQHPTLEDMQEAVVHKKVRPKIKDHWRKHQGLSFLADTIEECWDHDAEARLSASCVQERVSYLYRKLPPPFKEKNITATYVPVVDIKCALMPSVLLPPKESSM
ncbi:activin receptor type-2B-like [Ornithodoros turicata]|uniref:activin receptor type-2B-like n=1 Tax=Ornithodoros turicata TaxID=34597 RepID=UPI003138C92F